MIETLIWLTIGSIYLAGIFPAAIRCARASAEVEFCHQESRTSSGTKWSHRSDCAYYCRQGCWRAADEVTFRDLRATPLALAWPLLLVAIAAVRQANKKPSRRMLEAQIKRLERDAGIRP